MMYGGNGMPYKIARIRRPRSDISSAVSNTKMEAEALYLSERELDLKKRLEPE